MDRDFERFIGGPAEALQSRLHVTLAKSRSILLNRNVYERLGRPAAVRLYYSSKRDSIGIEPASINFDDSFPVKPASRSWRISSAPFCRHFGIVPDMTIKFVSPEFDGTSMMLKLGETVSVARGKRRPRERKA